MNYYEELGIQSDADEEEIRKAHRRLARLMHPDQHRDPAMKQLAETQMRRLNSIVTTLFDGERRQEYDEQLRASLTTRPIARTAWRKVPWWIGSIVGAVVLTVGAVWFWADHLGSSFNSPPPVYITPDSTTAVPAAKTSSGRIAKARREPPERIIATVVPSASTTERGRGVAESPKSNRMSNSPRTVQSATRQAAASRSQAQNASPSPLRGPNAGAAAHEEIGAPKPESVSTRASVPADTLHPARDGDPVVGEWVYSPKEPENHKPGLYPPEFISLKLSRNDRGLRGQYNARYDVTDNKPISPDVSFQLTAVDKTSRKFVWEANNGSRGTLAIRSIDGRTMRLEWRTTVFTGGLALTSGIATLERREP